MYCPSCGVAVANGLTYCNFCGAKLTGRGEGAAEQPDLRAGSLVFAMMATFIFGLVAITLLMGVMKSALNLDVGQILAFIVLSFLMLISIEGVFIWLLLRRTRGSSISDHKVLSKAQVTNELDAARERFLSEPLSSVTENTTRAFAKLKDER